MKHITYIDDVVAWRESFHFYHPVKVRFSETDMFGHLNNTIPFVYFEEARIEFFKSIGLMQEWTKKSTETIPVIANQQCDYLKQVFFGEELKIYVKVNEIGNSSIDIHYMAEAIDGSIAFVGRGTLVQISTITGKGAHWTLEQKHLFMNNVSC